MDNYKVEVQPRIGQLQKIKTEEILLELAMLYDNSPISFIVREFLTDWIESKPWGSITKERDAENILSMMISEIRKFASNERFSIKWQLEKAATEIKVFKDNPLDFTSHMEELLNKEHSLLMNKEKDNTSSQQVLPQDRYSKLFKNLEDLSQKIQNQIYDFKSDVTGPMVSGFANFNFENKKQEIKKGQAKRDEKFELMNERFKDELEYMEKELINISNKILHGDLQKWMNNQRFYGSEVETGDLNLIQKWYSKIIVLIQISRQQIEEIEEIDGIFYPQLRKSFDYLYCEIIKTTFIVSDQPPQIITVNNWMEASVCLLSGESISHDPLKVTVELISFKDEEKGKFQNKDCMMKLDQNQFIAKFKKMKLTNVQRETGKKGKCVTDEMYQLKFSMDIKIGKETLCLQTRSLPVVVISNVSQECKATASILWSNHFRDLSFPQTIPNEFPETVSWTDFANMLKSKFRKDIGVDLKPEHLENFKSKIFGNQGDRNITWDEFCKINMDDKKFTFWEWFSANIRFIQTCALELYQNNLIMGYISRPQADDILQDKCVGTFLLRFSDNKLGAISISRKGSAGVKHYYPLTGEKPKNLPLAQIIYDMKKLSFLYPYQNKIEIFKQYVKKQDSDNDMKLKGYEKMKKTVDIESDSDEVQVDDNGDKYKFSRPEMEVSANVPENFFSDQ